MAGPGLSVPGTSLAEQLGGGAPDADEKTDAATEAEQRLSPTHSLGPESGIGEIVRLFGAVDPQLASLISGGLGRISAPSDGHHPMGPVDLVSALMPAVTLSPVPAVVAEAPLANALQVWAESRGVTLGDAAASQAVSALDLDPDAEMALAKLILAYLVAEQLQEAAMADLNDAEIALLAFDSDAVAKWFDREPDATWADIDRHLASLVARIDVEKSATAAALLAATIDDVRPILEDSARSSQGHGSGPDGELPDDLAPGVHVPTSPEAEPASHSPFDDLPDELDPVEEALRPVLDATEPEQEYLVQVRRTGTVPVVTLPGLAIGGTVDNVYEDDYDFFVDLGGDDTYLAPSHGGAKPVVAGTDAGAEHVKLFLDAGSGNDTYAPRPAVVEVGGNFPRLFTTNPTLGGAHGAVSVFADLGGNNTFVSSLFAKAERDASDNQPQRSASTYVLGAAQGAGVYGGIGLLLTWNATNAFEAHVHAEAFDGDAIPRPTALAATASQGAGWLGVGVLANFAGKDDSYNASASAFAPSELPGSASQLNMAQGAARAGVGVLFDGGGRNDFRAMDGFAQGVAWTDSDTARMEPVGASVAARVDTRAAGSIALLWLGDGNDTLTAKGPAQAAAAAPTPLGIRQNNAWDQGTARPLGDDGRIESGPSVSLLIDHGGDDSYRAHGDGEVVLGQAASLYGSVALLVDLAGDDEYVAENGVWSQAAAIGATAILLDVSGNDRYLAAGASQGYGVDAPVMHHSARVCAFWFALLPCPVAAIASPQPDTSAFQVVLDVVPRAGVFGGLFDLDGIDRYATPPPGQGYVTDDVGHALRFAFCRSPDNNVLSGHDNVSGCPDGVPGSQGANGQRRDFIPARPIGPPTRGPLVGVLFDAEGTDSYLYEGAKEPRPPSDAIPGDGNDWLWRQEEIAERRVDQFGMPDNPSQGPDESLPGPLQGPSDLRDEYPDKVPGPVGSQSTPAPPTFGGGIDEPTFATAISALASALAPLGFEPPIQGSIQLSRDPNGTDVIDPGTELVQATVYVLVDVQSSVDLGQMVRDVHVFANGHHIGRALPTSQPTGGPRYVAAWNTLQADSGRPLYLDGAYTLVAAMEIGGPGGPTRMLESEPLDVVVDNPPVVEMTIDQTQFSAALGQDLTVTISVGPDVAFPDGVPPEGTPGALLSLRAVSDTTEIVLIPDNLSGYREAGVHEFVWNGQCASERCPDGTYNITLRATDVGGLTSELAVTVDLDNTPPESGPDLPPFASERVGSKLLLRWNATDAGPGATGVDTVDVIFLPEAAPASLVDGDAKPWPEQSSATFGPVATGQRLAFLTVARDAVGNSESPCLPEEAPPCYQAKLQSDPTSRVETVVDFDPPRVVAVRSSHDFIRPEVTPVVFTADIEEEGSSIASVLLSTAGQSFPMTLLPGQEGQATKTYALSTWASHNAGLPADEVPFVYTVTATDAAQNRGQLDGSATLDAVPPRVTVADTQYAENPLHEERLPLGRGGIFAILRADVKDASVDHVVVDADSVTSGTTVDLRFDAGQNLWVGELFLPTDIADGDYTLPLLARDSAGNEATAQALVKVRGQPVPITDFEAQDRGHDYVVLTWNTTQDATSQVAYGRTPALGKLTPPDNLRVTVHQVNVTALTPNTEYYMQARSEGASGVPNATTLRIFRTLSAIQLEFNWTQPVSAGGAVDAVVRTGLRTDGNGPVRTEIRGVPQEGGASPVLLVEHEAPTGGHNVTVPLNRLVDGPWRLRVDSWIPGDNATVWTAPFLVDNNGPILTPVAPGVGEGTASERPVVQVRLQDPGDSHGQQWHRTARLHVDGAEVPSEATLAAVEGSADEYLLSLTPSSGFRDGRVDVGVTVEDRAGNEGTVTWPIRIDTKGPTLDGDPRVAATQGLGSNVVAPGGQVRLIVNLSDVSGVAEASLDLTPVGASSATLQKTDSWTATITVPAGADEGRHGLPLRAVDALGNEATMEDAVEIEVDATPPRLVDRIVRPGAVTVFVELEASEAVAVAVTAHADGTSPVTAASDGAGVSHALRLETVTPGRDYDLEINLKDAAGNENRTIATVRTQSDTNAPGAVSGLRASSPAEGRAVVGWDHAEDDHGVQAYEIWRSDTESWMPLPSNRTTVELASVSTELTIRVRAIDFAGNVGPTSQVTVNVLLLPHLERPDIPEGPFAPGDPIEFAVVYRHASGRSASSVVLHVQDLSFPMVTTDTDCAAGCRYTVAVALDATTYFGVDDEAWFEAWDGSHQTRTTKVAAPLVMLDGEAGASASGFGAVVALSAALLALVGSRLWRRQP